MNIFPLGAKNLWLWCVHTLIIIGSLTGLHLLLVFWDVGGYTPFTFVLAVLFSMFLCYFFDQNYRNILSGAKDELKVAFKREHYLNKQHFSEPSDGKYPTVEHVIKATNKKNKLDNNPLL